MIDSKKKLSRGLMALTSIVAILVTTTSGVFALAKSSRGLTSLAYGRSLRYGLGEQLAKL